MFAIVGPTRSLESLYPINIFPPELSQHFCVFTVVTEMRVKYVRLEAGHKRLVLALTRNRGVNSRSTLKKECGLSGIFSSFLFVWHPVVTYTWKEKWEVNKNCTSQWLHVLCCTFRLNSKHYGIEAKAETYCIIMYQITANFVLFVRIAKQNAVHKDCTSQLLFSCQSVHR